MERKYRRYPNSLSEPLPLLEVRITNGENDIDLDCLVDSGSVDSMFSMDIADELELSLENCPTKDYIGVDGHNVTGHLAWIQLQVKGVAEPIEIEVAFVEGNQIPLLGQRGFFDNYEIRFQRFKWRFEIFRISEAGTNKYLM